MKKHKQHRSTYEECEDSKKKYRIDLLEKGRKENVKFKPVKNYDLAAYLNKNDLKRSTYESKPVKPQSTKRV